MTIKTTHTRSLLLGSLAAAVLLAACPAPKDPVEPVGNNTLEPDIALGDEPAGPAEFPQEEFRAAQPLPTEPRPFNLPAVTQFNLGDQIDVYLVERHELPTISVELNFDGGRVDDRPGKEGAASLCMSLASQGTQELDKLAFEEALADLASNVGSYAGEETQSITMQTLTKNFDATFALFTDTLLKPGHRKDELERMVQRRLQSLKQIKGSPSSVAGRLLDSTVAGPTHPHGRVVTEKSLGKISINDCKKHHKSFIKPKGARLFVVGDMTKEEIIEKFGPLLATWKGTPKKMAKIPAPKPRKGRVFFVDIPGAAQSSIYVAHMGPGRMDPNFFANQVMGGLLGGGFSSRINMNLREDKGYSYGARGNFRYSRQYGTFVASSSVRSDSTRQSIDEMLAEMQRLKDGTQAATEAEIAREKNGAILGLPARFATAAEALSQYETLVYFGLPMSYYNEYVNNFSGVTLEQVNEAAKTLLHPENAIVLVVGDASVAQITRSDDGKDVPSVNAEGQPVTLRAALEALAASELGGSGDFVVLDADGNVLKK